MPDDAQKKRPRTATWTLRAVATLVVLGVLALHGLYLHLHHSLPKVEGTAQVAGLTAKADIVRDAYGIPHIYAASKHDALFAEGYAHAQDRLAQMEFGVRFGEGRLAEVAGEIALPRDRFMRALDFKGVAERTYAQLPPRTRDALDAYAAGVNAFIDQHTGPWPLEFTLLSITPAHWRPENSIVLTKILALQLAGNLNGELSRATLLETQTPQFLKRLYPDLPGPLPKIAELYPAATSDHASLVPELLGASNNWAVSGAHSKDGKPLLANDPHLGLGLPCIWYLAHLAFDGHNLIGASLPGVPGIILGRNDDVAWGYTNSEVDAEDLVIERVDPENGDNYIAPDGSKPFKTRKETILVHSGQPVVETFRATGNGPVIPADLPSLAGLVPEGHVIALRWTALDDQDETVTAGLDAASATSGAEFVSAMTNWSSPTQNMLYADRGGTIGLLVAGRMPLHSPDNDTLGLLPVPGWDATYGWTGNVPKAEWPQTVNPEDGRLATANNKVVGDDYPYALGYEWDRDARVRRIRQLLDEQPVHDVASFAAMQQDTVSLEARDLVPKLIANLAMHPPQNALATEGRIRLSNWDGDMRADRPEPLLFAAWLRQIERGLVGDDLKAQTDSVTGWRFDLVSAVVGDNPMSQKLCDDVTTPEVEDCSVIISQAFGRALDELAGQYGRHMIDWRWGTVHQALLPNRTLGAFPVLGAMLERKVPSGGSADTINRGETWFASKTPFANIHASTYRAVYDLGDPQASIFIIAGGQSGNPFSRHYDDLVAKWSQGAYVPMVTDRAAIEAKFHETLTLTPPSAQP